MKITKTQLKQIIREEILNETKNDIPLYTLDDIKHAYMLGGVDGIGTTEPRDNRYMKDLDKLFLKRQKKYWRK